MAKIELAKTAGFCFGVNRAVKTVYELVDSGEKIQTLGPIIHNPQVVEDLEKKGVEIISSPQEANGSRTVVIRAHGVTKETTECLRENNIHFVDATCPYVTKIHKLIEENSSENIITMIAGDESHPEVCGFRSQCKGRSFVFRNLEELKKILQVESDFSKKQMIFVAQTTFSLEEWKICIDFLKKLCTNAIFLIQYAELPETDRMKRLKCLSGVTE